MRCVFAICPDDAQAGAWFREAAEQGYVGAQYNIGLIYANGAGVPKDDIAAYMWWNLAAAQGDEEARSNRSNIEKKMTPAQIAEAQQLSKNWKAKEATRSVRASNRI